MFIIFSIMKRITQLLKKNLKSRFFFYLLKHEYVQLYAKSMQLCGVGKKTPTKTGWKVPSLLCKRNIKSSVIETTLFLEM